jgi:hypothetical protein
MTTNSTTSKWTGMLPEDFGAIADAVREVAALGR